MEFHVSREARDHYQFSESLFSFSANVIFANLAASREFAQRMNEVRGSSNDPARTIRPGALYAMGLIDEVSHALVEFYRRQVDPPVWIEALAWFEERVGKSALDATLLAFVEQFPSVDVYRKKITALDWLQGKTGELSHRAIAFEEMMMLWLANANPAFAVFSELFSDQALSDRTSYSAIAAGLGEFFGTRPRLGRTRLTLVEMLRAPALASPDSLSGQLAFIREHWVEVLGAPLERLLLAIDVLKEEDVAIWMRFHPPSEETLGRRRGVPWDQDGVHSEVPSYQQAAQEYERFSPDQDWMPTTVLLAKSTYVWLEQLSRRSGRHIHRLDQIPDEELALMARRGFNALWLIGVWERSRASQTIKQLCGNYDAVASAYSLYGYTIAADLGGEDAYRNLRDRAMAHGVRLASDMVPNHMGIDSSWVIEHPEWFMSRGDSPYPSYRFDGPDLSSDGRVEIKIDDHYYERTDAAVVFRRRDTWTGDIRYVYHGNDGTSFPWNDTAQIDYLNAAAREQVIQTILQVARLFPIIRFDAAMTLAKRHFQRLWFPVPGTGGAIPSRAEYSMTRAQFDAAMPEEFWREVVDRVAREVPGTLLLAEAFWLMEGYFVRTLGMHRVYNSAFMNMMRDEENANYRSVIKNTLEFDPDILKRYVNFMSNPDERTTIDQFGRGDKCFGVAVMMSTLPGLPMFGHGQVEGFTEKYGMEYRKPRYDEQPDRALAERHDREVAPLLHRRWLFAESENFCLYDFFRPDGSVDENVFAYSNRRGDQRALVVYQNRYASTRGTIHHSAAYADKGAGELRRQSLGSALRLPQDGGVILAFRDVITGLEHLERSSKIVSEGFTLDLHAYHCQVFLDWRELRSDAHHPWDRLCDGLRGCGVASVDEALVQLELAPLHEALVALLQPDLLHAFSELAAEAETAPKGRSAEVPSGMAAAFLSRLEQASVRFFEEATAYRVGKGQRPEIGRRIDPADLWPVLRELVRTAKRLPTLETSWGSPWSQEARSVLPSQSPVRPAAAIAAPVIAWCVLHVLAAPLDPASPAKPAVELFEQLRLREPLAVAFAKLGISGEDGWRAAARVKLAFVEQTAAASVNERVAGFTPSLWEEPDAGWLMEVHESSGEVYFNKELHEQLVWWMELPALLEIADGAERKAAASATEIQTKIRGVKERVRQALEDAESAGYCTGRLTARKGRSAKDTVPAGKRNETSQTLTPQNSGRHPSQGEVAQRDGAASKDKRKPRAPRPKSGR